MPIPREDGRLSIKIGGYFLNSNLIPGLGGSGIEESALSLKRFVDTRAKLTNKNSGASGECWVDQFQGSTIGLFFDRQDFCTAGDTLAIELEGYQTSASLEATCVLVSGTCAVCSIPGEIRLSAARGESRHRVSREFIGEAVVDKMPDFVLIVDVSRRGMGLILGFECEQGAVIEVRVPEGESKMVFEATVTYCVPAPEHPGGFRVGVEFKELGRVQVRRWLLVVESLLAA